MKFMVCLLMLSGMSLISGCVKTSECDWAEPFRPQPGEQLSDFRVDWALAHNRKGAEFCGWKP